MPRSARAVVLVAALLLLMAGCGSGDGDEEESTIDIDEDYRVNPPEYSANLTTVRQTTMGIEPYRVDVRVWNLGTERDTYELSAAVADGVEPAGQEVEGFAATVDPAVVTLEGRSSAVVELTLSGYPGTRAVQVEMASPHLPLGEGLQVEVTGWEPGAVPPVVRAVEATTRQGEPVVVDVLAGSEAGERAGERTSAVDPASLRAWNVVPATGDFQVTADHRLRFVPDPTFVGTFVAVAEVCDVQGACAAGTITITVET